MKAEEFGKWLQDFGEKFPHKMQALQGPESNPGRMRAWAGVLSSVSLRGSLWANEQLLRGGEIHHIWDSIPAEVRKLAEEFDRRHGHRARARNLRSKQRNAIRLIRAGRRAGANDERIVAALERKKLAWSDVDEPA